MNGRQIFAGLACGAAIVASSPAFADEAQGDTSPTIDRIRQRGVIYAGFAEEAVPFSFVDERGNVQGYSWALCARIVDNLREALALPGLKMVAVPLTTNSSALAIRGGMADMDCGAVANTPAKARQLAFSRTIYVSTVNVLVKADSSINSLRDLDGKRIVTTLTSGAERYPKTANALRGANPVYVTARSHAESLAMVAGGQADAFVLDETRLAEARARTGQPGAYRILAENLSLESYALALPPGDEPFRKLVDDALEGLARNGEIADLYNRWFTTPALPGGINLDLPMSPMLKGALAAPIGR